MDEDKRGNRSSIIRRDRCKILRLQWPTALKSLWPQQCHGMMKVSPSPSCAKRKFRGPL
jgi:hypothetical protein